MRETILDKEIALERVEKLPIRYFGDVVHKSTLSDGENYRFLEFVYLYNETTNKIKMFYPADLIPKGLPIGDNDLPAYKARPEKKQEEIDKLKNEIEKMMKKEVK